MNVARPRPFTIHEGDVLEGLQALPPSSFDALLSDPPAGISFMGRDWDSDKGGRDHWIAWLASVMREALRVLRPGAHVLVWALPRTSHWTATAIEDAGFEIRECIVHLFGSGFPKSHNVSKAIDAANGDDRPAPASAESERWAGYGSALKPASEHWILARKPLDGTIAHNATTHGVGSINVDGCRVAHAGAEDFEAHRKGVEAIRAKGGTMEGSWKNSSDLAGANEVTTAGRWPANLVLTHSIDCVRAGTRTVVREILGADPSGSQVKSSGFTRGSHVQVHRDDTEALDVWQCAEGCPVRELDEQSGERPSTLTGRADPGVAHVHPADPERERGSVFGNGHAAGNVYADGGGASRFFPQFQWTPEDLEAARFFYTAKASRFERDFGCDDLPLQSAAERVDREPGSAGMASPRAGAGRTSGARNGHPTIKAVGLTRWLATLLLPPPRADGSPRRILVPFMGSGSEAIGALRAGWDHVHGIERDSAFVAIASSRLERWAEVPAHVDPLDSKPAKADGRQVSLFGVRP